MWGASRTRDEECSQPWSSLDKEESLACQIAYPFNNKLGCFLCKIKKIAIQKQPSLLLNGEAIWQASQLFDTILCQPSSRGNLI